MKSHIKLLVPGITVAILTLAVAFRAQADGAVNFANCSSNKVINGLTSSPVTNGSNIKAALYWAPTNSSTFTQLGVAVTVGVPAPGIFVGGMRTTGAATSGGSSAKFQVRAWGGGHATYEAALLQNGVLIGQSAVFDNATGNPNGSPPSPPESLLAGISQITGGLKSFTLVPNALSISPPFITCATNKPVNCGSAWTFDLPTAVDGCTGNNLAVVVVSTTTNGECPTVITRTWAVTNSCNTNFATCSQAVAVVDTTPPMLTCATNRVVQCTESWTFDPPSALDDCSSNVIVTILSTITNTGCGNSFTATRTWLATDACGNTNLCSQTIATVDTTPPVITCVSNKAVECGAAWAFDEPIATDTCNSNTVSVLSTITNAGCGNTFAATRTWLATDACGNTNFCSQTVTTVDTTAPVLTCAGNKTFTCGGTLEFDQPDASDACGGTNVTITVLSTVTNIICPLTVTRTWLATDACGNTNTCTQTVTGLYLNPPALTCATNKIVSCAGVWDFDVPAASDECGGTNVTVAVLGTVTNSLCPFVLTRTWAVTNGCDTNLITCSQTVTVLCPDCPVLIVTKTCPRYPVPPGGTLVWTGTVTNAGELTVSNIIVINDRPAPNTVVFGPVTLAPGASASFGDSYAVPGCSCGPHPDTLTVSGIAANGIVFSNSIIATCAGTNVITPGDTNGDGMVDQAELNVVLANYWAHSPWVYMTNAALVGDGKFQFELTNHSAWNFTVMVTTNLTDWTNLPGPAYPVYQFQDPEERTFHYDSTASAGLEPPPQVKR